MPKSCGFANPKMLPCLQTIFNIRKLCNPAQSQSVVDHKWIQEDDKDITVSS